MKLHNSILCHVHIVVLLIAATAFASNWYAGQWDSTVYVLSDHPHTIALRVEVVDRETCLPIGGAEVQLEGEWEEDSSFGKGDIREFKLTAVTGNYYSIRLAVAQNEPL